MPLAGQFESHLVQNPEDRFSHDEAYMSSEISNCEIKRDQQIMTGKVAINT